MGALFVFFLSLFSAWCGLLFALDVGDTASKLGFTLLGFTMPWVIYVKIVEGKHRQ